MSTPALTLYWHGTRGDNFTTATPEGAADAEQAAYKPVRVEGYVYTVQVPGTVPLKQYWHGANQDNYLTATEEGEEAARRAGYRFVRIEGNIHRFPAPDTVPLKLYWHPGRRDNFTCASSTSTRAPPGTSWCAPRATSSPTSSSDPAFRTPRSPVRHTEPDGALPSGVHAAAVGRAAPLATAVPPTAGLRRPGRT